MNEILAKISSYNIFNYLLPGTVYVTIVEQFTSFSLAPKDLLLALFFYYLIGLIISRLGSLIVAPLMKRTNFVKFLSHKRYVAAAIADSKIDILSAENNVYRTLTSLFILVLFTIAADQFFAYCPSLRPFAIPVLSLSLVVLFAFSFKKQSSFIVSRIKSTEEE